MANISTASQPSGADSTSNPASSKIVSASILLISISSTSKMRKPSPAADSGADSVSGAGAASASFNGKSTVKDVPFPFSLSTEIEPPITSSKCLAIESPKPMPDCPLFVDDDSRSNFW